MMYVGVLHMRPADYNTALATQAVRMSSWTPLHDTTARTTAHHLQSAEGAELEC